MTPLTGLGIWIWELPACEHGDPSAIADRANASGVSWVVVKAGAEGPNGQVTTSLVAALRAKGIECAAWWYCYPHALDAQIAYLKALAERAGVAHFVMDAESEWDAPDQRSVARQFAGRLRAALGPDAFLADAPWARPVMHKAPFPYDAFGSVMNARMPQFYWQLAAPESCTSFFATADAEWATTAPTLPASLICPALSPVNFTGAVHAPVHELAVALDRYAARQSLSIWSWQHLRPDEWALLAARAVEPWVNPLAGAPVAGLVIDGETDVDVGGDPKGAAKPGGTS